MRDTVRTNMLRRFVRAVLMREAPLADVLPYATKDLSDVDPSDDLLRRGQTQTRKFFATKKFRDDAIKAYRNLSVPIYVVPVFSTRSTAGLRSALENESDVPKQLDRLIYSLEKIAELREVLRAGAAIFLVGSHVIEKGFLPTPWMIVHAMVDQSVFEEARDIAPVDGMLRSEVRSLLESVRLEMRVQNWNLASMFRDILTMGSARDGAIQNVDDAAAEIVTQSILTANGFDFNPTGNEKADAALERIAGIVSGCRADFESRIAGRIVAVTLS